MTKLSKKPALLLILDGWGYSEDNEYNAINMAKKPVWDRLWKEYPHTLVRCSGPAVGLPANQMGNSEVGHLNIGAGRVVYQEFTRVSRAIKTGSFFSNQTLTDAIDCAISCDHAVHILGLLSPGGVHSHEDHIHAMIKLAIEHGAKRVYLHAFLDGRDTAPKSAESSLIKMRQIFDEIGGGEIVSIMGRYYSMDRDHRWIRVQSAYDLMTQGKAKYSAKTALKALEMAYERGESDEFVQPTKITGKDGKSVTIDDGDVVVFMNYRSDRARQLTRTFIEDDFDGFKRKVKPKIVKFVSLTEYNKDFNVEVAYPSERLNNVLGEYISKLGLLQLRIAETEKYAHVTFFFNGGVEQPFEGEDRIMVPSPHVATYDLQPEMSADTVTDKLIEAIDSEQYDTIICNFANPDMVGHTGNYEAAIKAIETIDYCLGRIITKIHSVDGEVLITADHGNAEKMLNQETAQKHTSHTTNLVPLIYVGRPATLSDDGALCDLAPSLLELMGIEPAPEMVGRSLLNFSDKTSE
ncbi:MAG: 2,3-bisphosphoglycerate-independent phosphoglycerate mutase [Methylococcales bacterium]|nr:2,3-bisphosphoglycerate-independent phosphoglycerate mutase [Methylococcales bacterium]